MRFIAGLGVGIALIMGGGAQAQEPAGPTKPALRQSAETAVAAEAHASDARAVAADDSAANAEEPGPMRRFNGSFGSETVIGPFKRPQHLRGERPDYMRAGRGAVGLAVSFRLGG